MIRRGLIALLVTLFGCSAPRPLAPFPYEALDAEGREAVVVYWTGLDPRTLAWVSGRLISAESNGVYLWSRSGPVHLVWGAIRAVSVPDPDRPYLRAHALAATPPMSASNALEIARSTRIVDRATPQDRVQLARLSRFPAGRPPPWRLIDWPAPDAVELERPNSKEVSDAASALRSLDYAPASLSAPGP